MDPYTNSSCPAGSIPDGLPIPQNITYAVIPGTNASDPWMTLCCEPNPVHIASNCWEWCQVPEAPRNHSTSSAIAQQFGGCLLANGRNITQSNGLSVHVTNSSPSNNNCMSLAGIAVVALTMSILLA